MWSVIGTQIWYMYQKLAFTYWFCAYDFEYFRWRIKHFVSVAQLYVFLSIQIWFKAVSFALSLGKISCRLVSFYFPATSFRRLFHECVSVRLHRWWWVWQWAANLEILMVMAHLTTRPVASASAGCVEAQIVRFVGRAWLKTCPIGGTLCTENSADGLNELYFNSISTMPQYEHL